MAFYPTPPVVPTLSAWQGAQRYALAAASRATPSRRARSDLDSMTAVLLYALARIPPASFRMGQIADHTGLTAIEVLNAIADLEDAGLLENGSARSGRLGILTPEVLAVLGVAGYGIAREDVRADVHPPGFPAELSDEDLTEAFA